MTVYPQKVNWWYESIVDWMLLNPDKSKADAARFFNVSSVWMYTLTQSDVFKALYEQRRAAHNGVVSASIVEKVSALADVALEHLTERVAKNGESMTPGLLKDIAEMSLEKLGYDGKYGKSPLVASNPSVNVQVNLQANAVDLAEARQKMTQRGQEIAARPVDVLPKGSVLKNPDGSLRLEPLTPLDAITKVIEGEVNET